MKRAAVILLALGASCASAVQAQEDSFTPRAAAALKGLAGTFRTCFPDRAGSGPLRIAIAEIAPSPKLSDSKARTCRRKSATAAATSAPVTSLCSSGKSNWPTQSGIRSGNGLYDVLGNAKQWTEDCWHGDYSAADRYDACSSCMTISLSRSETTSRCCATAAKASVRSRRRSSM
jgi:hypothetical protein